MNNYPEWVTLTKYAMTLYLKRYKNLNKQNVIKQCKLFYDESKSIGYPGGNSNYQNLLAGWLMLANFNENEEEE